MLNHLIIDIAMYSLMNDLHLTQIFESGMTEDPLDEILFLAGQVSSEIDQKLIRHVHHDITSIFSGTYPGYKASIHQYHDLRHTHGVVLATIRLFHGLVCDGNHLPPKTIQRALISAYFHDSGLLLQETDSAESGANYTKFHESRSIQCLHKYLKDQRVSETFCHECATIIRFTNINLEPRTPSKTSEAIQLGGKVVGTADLLAQMADRYYLESLPLLFKEHQAGGLSENKSAAELIQNTAEFYREVIKKRLEITFDNMSIHMKTHFKERFHIDRNLYQENINKNMQYLESILDACDGDCTCIQHQLRRKQSPIPS